MCNTIHIHIWFKFKSVSLKNSCPKVHIYLFITLYVAETHGLILSRSPTFQSGRIKCTWIRDMYTTSYSHLMVELTGSIWWYYFTRLLIIVVLSIMLYSSEISPTRCNNCVFFLLHLVGLISLLFTRLLHCLSN